MSRLSVLFLVNGTPTSASGIRAKSFAERLPSTWQIHFRYRSIPKWQGMLSFIQAGLYLRPQIIYVVDVAYAGVLAGCLGKILTGCKLITDTGDVAYELAQSTGKYSRTQLALIDWVERLAIKFSDRLIVRGSYHKAWLEHQGNHTVEFVPDGVDTDAVAPVNATSLRERLGLGNHLVVGLVGTMSWSERYQMCYGWDIIAALRLLPNYPVKALLVGEGNGRAILENLAQEFGVADRVVFTGQIPYGDLPEYLAAMDVCVSTQSNNLVGQVRTTGKLPLYLAYGKYVIATDVGEASRVLPGVGCLLPYEGIRDDQHPARLAVQLKRLLAKPERLQVNASARQIAKAEFDYQILAQRIERVCRELVEVDAKRPGLRRAEL
jgi:glycosyltransferase involved in cell wall biosynthesis